MVLTLEMVATTVMMADRDRKAEFYASILKAIEGSGGKSYNPSQLLEEGILGDGLNVLVKAGLVIQGPHGLTLDEIKYLRPRTGSHEEALGLDQHGPIHFSLAKKGHQALITYESEPRDRLVEPYTRDY